MDAVVIAAGFGSRLNGIADLKPLARVAGVPLIEIVLREAALAGARRAVVVTGYRADELEAALPAIAERAGLQVVTERVQDWSKPNGFSVMAGASRVGRNYLLMMSDHLLSAPILSRLAGQDSPDRGVTLAIDRRTVSPILDPDDATWVRTGPDGRIQAIGKNLTEYDAVDCGAFLATPELACAIGQAVEAGKAGSLSDGMQWLANAGRAATMDIGTAWWLDVDDAATHAIAEQEAARQLPEIFGKDAMIARACQRQAP